MNWPDPSSLSLARIRQRFPTSHRLDLDDALRQGLAPVLCDLPPGRIAVAVGSRGISNLATIVRGVVDRLRAAGARPFIIPAMGSHGGGMPSGQTALLASYGVTAAALGVPVEASMEVRYVGVAGPGYGTVCSTAALDADGVILINRVKPHTDFGGAIGSGLLKMLVVGLGKQAGAAAFHAAASRHGHARVLHASAELLLRHVPLLCGIALIEDERHQTARLEVVRPEQMLPREPELCAEARARMPRLPFAEIDLLVVDWIGKNISGTGLDPAVIGRMIHGYSLAEDAPASEPRVRRLFVRDLTPESHGNAIGIGLADFTTNRLVRAMDRDITAVNALTALSLQGAKVPLAFETDREALERALGTLALPDPGAARVVRIRDTLSLEQIDVSTALLPAVAGRSDLEVMGDARPLTFVPGGDLPPF